MKIMYLKAPYSGDVELCPKTLDYLQEKDYQKIVLFASIQFVNNLDKIERQLKELGIDIISTKPARAHVSRQLLGCDSSHGSLNLEGKEFDAFLYIGDGRFHPLALVYAQKDLDEMKEIVCNDPVSKGMSLLEINDVRDLLKKYRGSLMKFFTQKNVGILITIKPGQEQYLPALALEKKFPDKKFYFFVDNNISFDQLENFNFIDVWVNTACPRIGLDDQEKFSSGVVNLSDALQAEKILCAESVFKEL